MPPLRLLTWAAPVVAALVMAGCATSSTVNHRSAYTGRAMDDLPPIPAYSLEDYAQRNEGLDGAFFRIDRTLEHTVVTHFGDTRETWEFTEDVVQQYLVLNPEEEAMTTLEVRVKAPRRLEGAFMRVTAPDGSARTFGVPDFVVSRDDEETTYKLAYPGVERGSVIEEHYRIVQPVGPASPPPLWHAVPVQYSVPVDSVRFRYVYPSGWALQFKEVAPGRHPVVDVRPAAVPDRAIVEYRADGVPALQDEPYAPYFREVATVLEFRVASVRQPGVEWDNVADWGALGSDFAKYAFRRGTAFADPAGQAVRAILDGSEPDSVKFERIVTWVQNEIEVGDFDETTHQAVLRGRRGNVHLITGVTQAMLVHAGLEAEYLLLHDAADGHFDRAFISGNQFYMPAVGVQLGGSWRVAFPYLRGLAVGSVPAYFQGQPAMRITADGFAGFTTLPPRDASEYAVDEHYDVMIGDDGSVRVEEEKTLRGVAAWSMRRRIKDLDASEREELVRDLLTYNEGEVRDLTYEFVGEDAPGEPLRVRLGYVIDHLVTITPEEVLFQTGGLLSPASLRAFKVDVRERQNPVRVYYDELNNKRITIRYPEGWALTTPLADVTEENRFGRVTGAYDLQPGTVAVEQRIHLKAARAGRESYPSLLRLVGSQSDLYVPTLVFSLAASGTD